MTKRQYDTLSRIAPTVAQTDDYIDYGMPWEDQLELTGKALGRPDEAAAVEKRVEDDFAAARKEHPEFAGKTLVFAAATPDGYAVYSTQDLRARFFEQLGFKPSQEVEKLAGDNFFAQVSAEQLRHPRRGRARALRRAGRSWRRTRCSSAWTSSSATPWSTSPPTTTSPTRSASAAR